MAPFPHRVADRDSDTGRRGDVRVDTGGAPSPARTGGRRLWLVLAAAGLAVAGLWFVGTGDEGPPTAATPATVTPAPEPVPADPPIHGERLSVLTAVVPSADGRVESVVTVHRLSGALPEAGAEDITGHQVRVLTTGGLPIEGGHLVVVIEGSPDAER